MKRFEQPSSPNFNLVNELSLLGYKQIIGVDEVGRGALAGPVVVAAVEVGPKAIPTVRDSKKLNKKQRFETAALLHTCCPVIKIGTASNQEIDELGMSAALALAYNRALKGISADLILTDHYSLPGRKFLRATKGDNLFYPVAAASIVAKVYRDQLMTVYSRFHSPYCWEQNAGYGTAKHKQALQENGPSPLHRLSFLS